MEGCRKSEEGREGWRVRAREGKGERGRVPDSLSLSLSLTHTLSHSLSLSHTLSL